MSDSQLNPWSDRPDAPNIPYDLYSAEKATFAGNIVCSILYGIATMVFFRCMIGLFDPEHRRGKSIKWGLVSYTVVMFSILTVITAMSFNIFSITFIDNRQFSGVEGLIPPGPLGYSRSIAPMAIAFLPDAMTVFNNWLADGLLLYRCYVLCSRNPWAIGFPCLMYLGSIAAGSILIHRTTEVDGNYWPPLVYLSISVSLNVLLTLIIIFRIVRFTRDTRAALGTTGIDSLPKSIITMFIESCALYSASSLLVLGPMSAYGNSIMDFFVPVLPATRVIASLLIIQRVVDKSALASNAVASGHLGAFKARSGGRTTDTGGALPASVEDPAGSVDRRGVGSGEVGVGGEITIE